MTQSETDIRALIEDRIAAIRGKDAERAIAALSDDIVAFELAPPLAVQADKARDADAFGKWLAGFSAIDVEVRDLKIEVDGNIGFAHALHHLVATRSDGRSVAMWMRSTLGVRREDGGWKIAHAHTSVPFTMDNGFRAAVNLQP